MLWVLGVVWGVVFSSVFDEPRTWHSVGLFRLVIDEVVVVVYAGFVYFYVGGV